MIKVVWRDELIRGDPDGGWQGGHLALDPGGGVLGWAYWMPDVLESSGIIHPIEVGTIAHSSSFATEYFSRCQKIFHDIVCLRDTLSPSAVYIEMPRIYASALNAGASDSIVKLSFLVGSVSAVFWARTSVQTFFVFPDQWKGQMPKEVSAERTARDLGYSYIPWKPLDCMDAVGLGLWCLDRRREHAEEIEET